MTYYAHSGQSDDGSDWQVLKAHLEQVAVLAAEMAEPLGLGKAAFLAGLFHDLGKYTADFQKRLTGAEVRVDHSTAGAWHVLQAVQGQDRFVAELVAYGGVDRNLEGYGVRVRPYQSPPSRRRGSKRPDDVGRDGQQQSPPSRRRGSKRYHADHKRCQPVSPPSRRRGSKPQDAGYDDRRPVSPPSRRRGSKLRWRTGRQAAALSPPSRRRGSKLRPHAENQRGPESPPSRRRGSKH